MRKLAGCSLAVIVVFSLVAVIPRAFAWEKERPGGNLSFSEKTENATTDGRGEVGIGVGIADYDENKQALPSDGNDDVVTLNIVATANTRNNTYYVCSERSYYSWVDDSLLSNVMYLGDNEVRYVSFAPSKVRFYGGPSSGEYSAVWICSNGWLSFYDPQRPNAPSAMPYCGAFPSTSGINNFVAPLWRDLKPNAGGSIEINYGWVEHWPGSGPTRTSFVVSWDARDKYGNAQVFQVFLDMAPPYIFGQQAFWNSMIWFQYETVTATDATVVGVEDQAGSRCASYSYSNLHNGAALQLCDSDNYAGVKYLQIRMVENDPEAWATLDTTPALTRGRNVNLEQNLPGNPAEPYVLAASGGMTLLTYALLLTRFATYSTGVGIVADCVFIGIDLYTYFAEQQAAAVLLDWDPDNAPTTATATAEGPVEGGLPVDASLCLTAYWVLTDQNTASLHSLTVGAILWYENFESDGYPVSLTGISATVQLELKRDNNNSFGTAIRLQSSSYLNDQYIGGYDGSDYFVVNVNQGYEIDVTAWARIGDPLHFSIELYNPDHMRKIYSPASNSPQIIYVADSSGDWHIKVCKYDYDCGFYYLSVNVWYPSGGGGCPTLYVRDGSGTTGYYCEGLLDIHNPDGVDVATNRTLASTPLRTYGTYALRLTEHPKTISHIDQVKLYATLESGVTIQLPLIGAWHSEYGNVLPQLMFSDDWKTETIGSDHNNGISQSIDLYFLAPPPNIHAKAYTFQIEGNNPIGKT